MKITVSGRPGSGKSTVAKLAAKKLKLKHFSTGDFMREMAEKRGLTIMEFSRIAGKDPSIDKELDDWNVRIGKTKDNFIIDGRLSFHFIPDSIKVFLDVDLDEAAKRIFKQERKEEFSKTIRQAKEKLEQRMNLEKKRYKKLYNIDCYDLNNYDIVIDTTNLTINQVVDKLIKSIKAKV